MPMRSFYVKPHMPDRLKPLFELAYNVWTTWDQEAIRLFDRIDPSLFRRLNKNPVEFIHYLGTERLRELANDPGFLFELEQVWYKFITYLSFEGTYLTDGGEEKAFGKTDIIAYLSMEFSLHESIPIYSGGLGILAGDYLKAASDVGLPLIGFGLLYRYGYFSQRINMHALQEEEYKENIWRLKPVEEVFDPEGQPVVFEVPLKNNQVKVKLWKVNVGRTTLYLMDTNVPDNPPEIQAITNMLYDPNRDDRIEQELILGRGARLAMRRLGLEPRVYHLNEGHSAFLVLERLKELMLEQKLGFEEAANLIRHSTVFTTHTPVIEGNEHFDRDLVVEYIQDDLKELGLPLARFLRLGQVDDKGKTFWLPALAIRFARYINGVSPIHAQVSRRMWHPLFADLHEREIPITSVNNGVHLPTWMSKDIAFLFDRYVGPDYLHKAEDPKVWERVAVIPDAELWEAHQRAKRDLISFVRRRLGAEMERKGFAQSKIREVEDVLSPSVLTIGFARRFAPYKRANLILQDPDRLKRILLNPDRPVQVIMSGKSHPADTEGKRIMQEILHFIRDHDLETKFVFVEDYDMDVGRHLVQGVDVWLNTPLKPLEASGTSGMKAGVNGALNMSVMDGWWPECYNGRNGWAITAGEKIDNLEAKALAEANQIYELLEEEITAVYYDRSEGDLPRGWIEWMKNSIDTVGRGFNIHAMLRGYLYSFYLQETETLKRLTADDGRDLKALTELKGTIDRFWNKLYIKDFFSSIDDRVPAVEDEVSVDCYVFMDDAPAELITAEVVYSYGQDNGHLERIGLEFAEAYPDKVAKFSGRFKLREPGLQEMGVRIRPTDELFFDTHPKYVRWADTAAPAG